MGLRPTRSEAKMKKDKPKAAPKPTKPIVVARGKVEGRGAQAGSCAGCAGSKFC
jgi:hypothetical protein